MSAVITDQLKHDLVHNMYNEVLDSDNTFFIGIGRSEAWNDSDTTPSLTGTRREQLEFRLSLQSVKLAEDISFVIPRHNWSNGTIYGAYNDDVSGYGSNAYYVLTAANAVYMCLEQGKDATGVAVPSTVEPVGASTTSFATADGYVWKFLYTLSADNATKFLSANYMPIKLQDATDSDSPANDIEQETIQDAAIEGQIGSIRVTGLGAGYSSTPTVVIEGDGTGASATATLSGTNVVKITLDSDGSGNIEHGSGYTYAKISLTGGTPTTDATAEAVIATPGGFGADPRIDLKSTGIMFNAKPDGTESGDFIVGNDFRQVGLLKNIAEAGGSTLYTNSTGLALSYLDFNTVTNGFTVDRVIVGATSGAKALVDYYDSTNGYVYFHQTHETGFEAFTNGESISEEAGSGAGTLESSNATIEGDINPYSGDVLYIENRAAIDRSADQTEDIKLVIRF